MKKTLVLGVAATLVAVGAWSFGCSSSSSSGGTSDDGGTGATDSSATTRDGGGTTGGGDAATSGAGGDGGTTGNPDQSCAANGADADSCSQCCIDNHMAGQQTFITTVHTCECGTNGPCRSVCANTFCASQPMTPDQACLGCLQKDIKPDAGTPCYGQVDQACAADQDCVAEQTCFGICPQ